VKQATAVFSVLTLGSTNSTLSNAIVGAVLLNKSLPNVAVLLWAQIAVVLLSKATQRVRFIPASSKQNVYYLQRVCWTFCSHPEDGCSTFLRNVKLQLNYVMPHYGK
jgi:hypothetical protein